MLCCDTGAHPTLSSPWLILTLLWQGKGIITLFLPDGLKPKFPTWPHHAWGMGWTLLYFWMGQGVQLPSGLHRHQRGRGAGSWTTGMKLYVPYGLSVAPCGGRGTVGGLGLFITASWHGSLGSCSASAIGDGVGPRDFYGVRLE